MKFPLWVFDVVFFSELEKKSGSETQVSSSQGIKI